jgi:hypothetical protein
MVIFRPKRQEISKYGERRIIRNFIIHGISAVRSVRHEERKKETGHLAGTRNVRISLILSKKFVETYTYGRVTL